LSTLHFLNVGQGDCTIIQHISGRCSVIDICSDNYQPEFSEVLSHVLAQKAKGNFRMCDYKTNPIMYLKRLGISSIWRFILTHPEMDHLDGFDALAENFILCNFWDSGVRKEKPEFENCPYKEEDWVRYEKIRDGNETVNVISVQAGSRFQYANCNEQGESGGDGLYILAPDQQLVDQSNNNGDANDASYVVLYRSSGGKILIPGDAHDKTWEYVLKHYKESVENCSILIAPHHGRKSGRSYEFLDVVKPKLTFFGCAPSENLAYDAWHYRELPIITNNQTGNIIGECSNGHIDLYIENRSFAEKLGANVTITNSKGYYNIGRINNT